MSKLLKFYKDGCAPCNMVENYLQSKGVEYESIHAFQNPKLAAQYELASVPAVILVDDEGNKIKESFGFKPSELDELISQL